jgi:hypothetical protein
MLLYISIDLSQITIKIENVPDEHDINTLRNSVRSVVFNIVNSYGYIKGSAFEIEITKILKDSGEHMIFGVEIPVIEQRYLLLSQEDKGVKFNNLLNLTYGPDGKYFRRCLSDCMMSMRHPEDTGFYCYRALESLKQYFSYRFKLEEKRDVVQWRKMVEELGITESHYLSIESWRKPYAYAARHGVPEAISEEWRIKIFNDTWEAVDKYVSYRSSE